MKPVIRTMLRIPDLEDGPDPRTVHVCDEAVKLAVKRVPRPESFCERCNLRALFREKKTFVFSDWSRIFHARLDHRIVETAVSGRKSGKRMSAGFLERNALPPCAAIWTGLPWKKFFTVWNRIMSRYRRIRWQTMPCFFPATTIWMPSRHSGKAGSQCRM